MLRGVVGRIASGASAAAAGGVLAANPSISDCRAPRARVERGPDADVRKKTNLEISQDLSKHLQGDESWVLAERFTGSISREEVNQTVEEIINLGSSDGLFLQEVSSYDNESVDSCDTAGSDANALIEAADRVTARRVPEQVPAMVYELLRDPGVQRECLRVMQDSPSFRELLMRGPLTLPPPPASNVYLRPGAFNIQSHRLTGGTANEKVDESEESLTAAVIAAIAAGLEKIGRGFGDFFASLGSSIRQILNPGPSHYAEPDAEPSAADTWIGSIFSVACAVFAMIVLKRARYV